jgi:hypothetical protein
VVSIILILLFTNSIELELAYLMEDVLNASRMYFYHIAATRIVQDNMFVSLRRMHELLVEIFEMENRARPSDPSEESEMVSRITSALSDPSFIRAAERANFEAEEFAAPLLRFLCAELPEVETGESVSRPPSPMIVSPRSPLFSARSSSEDRQLVAEAMASRGSSFVQGLRDNSAVPSVVRSGGRARVPPQPSPLPSLPEPGPSRLRAQQSLPLLREASGSSTGHPSLRSSRSGHNLSSKEKLRKKMHKQREP